jgi:2-oxoglutarate ferredoxin oxidoreductase subunit delta
MAVLNAPENTPVWVDEARCKACDKCVDACPAGVLAMRQAPENTLGSMITVVHPESCIGCGECELICPDFAIFVADKKSFKFAKLSEEAKQRAEQIKENNYRVLGA